MRPINFLLVTEKVKKQVVEDALYLGPPPPSGTVQVMSWVGTLISHSLQWIQFYDTARQPNNPISKDIN